MSRAIKWAAFLVDVAYQASAQDVALLPLVAARDYALAELSRRAYLA